MSTLVIWNPTAGSAEQAADLRRQLEQQRDVCVTETSAKDEAFALARSTDADFVIAAGGDGTVNAVVNGLAHNLKKAVLAILPLGTGNSLCRTLAIPLEPNAAMEVIRNKNVRDVDVVKMQADGATSHFINTASGGNSERVIDLLTPELKLRWGPWCYLRCALPVVADLYAYEVELEMDNCQREQLGVWNIVVANGRTAAGGLPVAPRASLEDGLLDVIVILDGTPLDTAALAAEFFLGDYLEDPRVIFRRVKQMSIKAQPELRFLVDGEIISGSFVEFQIEARRQPIIVGPEYQATIEPCLEEAVE